MHYRRLRVSALLGIIGPVVFVAGWMILGAKLLGYSPRSEPISELARRGVSTHTAMTLIFVFFSLSSLAFSFSLRPLSRNAARAMVFHGIGGMGAAVFPLGMFKSDLPHEFFAGVVYISIGLFPLFSTFAKNLAISTSVIIGVSLCISVFGPETTLGLFQRIGLTLGDAWMAYAAVRVFVGDASTM
jgi:hypothetical protein